jgi:hypothetical protein
MPLFFAKCRKAFGEADLSEFLKSVPQSYPQTMWTKIASQSLSMTLNEHTGLAAFGCSG